MAKGKSAISNISIKISVSFLLFFFVSSSFAFKVDTHVWIGQQVLNDLSDNAITIDIDGNPQTFPVDPAVADAIKSNPSQFRMGNIGPDALPDILTGQQVVHPGIPTGWKTDDWLEWLLKNANTPDEKAFAYGYLGHAAADIFAHTYINQYAGSEFKLFDTDVDPTAQVEIRHFLLESYIAKHNPDFIDANGSNLGAPYNIISTPSDFIVRSLIFNDTATAQYDVGGGAGIHLSAINRLRNNLKAFLAPDGDLAKIEAFFAAQAISYATNLSINQNLALDLVNLQNQFTSDLNNAVDKLQATKDAVLAKVSDVVQDHAAQVAKLNTGVITTIDLTKQLLDLAGQLAAETQKLNAIPDKIAEQICNNVCSNNYCGILFPTICGTTCSLVCSDVWKINPLWLQQKLVVDNIQSAIDAAKAALNKLDTELTNAVNDLVKAQLAYYDLLNQEINLAIDVAQRYTFQLDPLRGHLEGYLKDIEDSMYAYVGMSQDTIIELMKPNGSPLAPAKNWLECWGPSVLLTIPGPITNANCKVISELEAINAEIDKLLNEILSNPLINPLLAQAQALKVKIQTLLEEEAKKLAYEFANRLTGLDVEKLVDMITSDPSATLNTVFSSDNTSLGLLIIPDMAQRADAEMHLSPAGSFDSTQFSVVKDAITMAKLALLSVDQLNNLAQATGAGRIYGLSGNSIVNVLVGAVQSIDGNHQWMELAPPYPRTLPDPLAAEHTYGYPFNPTGIKTGMLLWNSDDAAANAFRRIFQGPLNGGLYTPDAFTTPFTNVLPDTVQYHPTTTNPFPTWCKDNPERTQACTGSFLPVVDRNGNALIQSPSQINITWSGNAPPAGYVANVVNSASGVVVRQINALRFRQNATTGYWEASLLIPRRTVSGDYFVQFMSATVDPTFGLPKSDLFTIVGL